MNCIREADNYLRYYRELHQSIEHADYMINKLVNQTAPKDMSAVSMDITEIRAGKPCNTLNQMYQLQMWQEMKERTQVEIDKVNFILESISRDPECDKYKDILFMWYVTKDTKEFISYELGYSERSIYYIKEKAIRKFSVALFGIQALQAI